MTFEEVVDQALAMFRFRICKPDGLFEDRGIALWIRQYRNEIVHLFSPLLACLDRSSRCRQLALTVEVEMLLFHEKSTHRHRVGIHGGDEFSVQLPRTCPTSIIYLIRCFFESHMD